MAQRSAAELGTRLPTPASPMPGDPTSITPRTELLAGIRALLPSLPGVAVFSLIIGIAAASGGVSVYAAGIMAMLVFAGTSQLVALQMLAVQAPTLMILVTVLVINLRFLMYSLSMAPHFGTLPLRWKALMAYVLTDQVYAFSALRFNSRPDAPFKQWFTLGAGLTLGVRGSRPRWPATCWAVASRQAGRSISAWHSPSSASSARRSPTALRSPPPSPRAPWRWRRWRCRCGPG